MIYLKSPSEIAIIHQNGAILGKCFQAAAEMIKRRGGRHIQFLYHGLHSVDGLGTSRQSDGFQKRTRDDNGQVDTIPAELVTAAIVRQAEGSSDILEQCDLRIVLRYYGGLSAAALLLR